MKIAQRWFQMQMPCPVEGGREMGMERVDGLMVACQALVFHVRFPSDWAVSKSDLLAKVLIA